MLGRVGRSARNGAGGLDQITVRGGGDGHAEIITDRLITRRRLDPATGGSVALLVFNSAEAVALTSAVWSVPAESPASAG